MICALRITAACVCTVGTMWLVYMHGPRVSGMGFWEGAPHADICAQMTGVSADMWHRNQANCFQLIVRKFLAFVIGCCLCGAMLAANQLGWALLIHTCRRHDLSLQHRC